MIISPVNAVTQCIIQLKEHKCTKEEAWGLYQKLVEWISSPDHTDYAEAVLLTSFFARALYDARVFEYDDLVKVQRKTMEVKPEPEPALERFSQIPDSSLMEKYEKVIRHLSTCNDVHCLWFTTVFSLVDRVRKRNLVGNEEAQVMHHRAFQVIVKHQDHALQDEDAIDFLRGQGFQIQSVEEVRWKEQSSPVQEAITLLMKLRDSWEYVKDEGLQLCGQLTSWISIPTRPDYHEAVFLVFLLARALFNKEMISEKRYKIVTEKAAQKVLIAQQSKIDYGLYKLLQEYGFEIEPIPPRRFANCTPTQADFNSCIHWLSTYDGENVRLNEAKQAFQLAHDELSFFRAFLMTVIRHNIAPETLGIEGRVQWSWISTFSNHYELESQELLDQVDAAEYGLSEE